MAEPTTKTCSRCTQNLPLEAFGPDRSRRDGCRRYCRDCERAYNREWTARNPEKRRAKDIRYWENNKAKYRKYQRDYARQRRRTDEEFRLRQYEIRDRHQKRHPDRVAASYRRYAQANSDKRRAKEARRRARQAGSAVGAVDYTAILERDGHICHICGESLVPNDLHFDHIVPLARGGAHVTENIAVAHARCNLSKGDRLLEELRADESGRPAG